MLYNHSKLRRVDIINKIISYYTCHLRACLALIKLQRERERERERERDGRRQILLTCSNKTYVRPNEVSPTLYNSWRLAFGSIVWIDSRKWKYWLKLIEMDYLIQQAWLHQMGPKRGPTQILLLIILTTLFLSLSLPLSLSRFCLTTLSNDSALTNNLSFAAMHLGNDQSIIFIYLQIKVTTPLLFPIGRGFFKWLESHITNTFYISGSNKIIHFYLASLSLSLSLFLFFITIELFKTEQVKYKGFVSHKLKFEYF
jgi:hypothetical protein